MNRHKQYTHHVPDDLTGKHRLKDYVKDLFPYLETGSAVKKAFQKGRIKLNDKQGQTGDWVLPGDVVLFEYVLLRSDDDQSKVDILFEDQDVMIVRKPPGLVSSGRKNCLQELLKNHEIEEGEGALLFPYLVHRLDKATEGIMIAAKNLQVRRLLSEMLEQHRIVKHYVLIVEGKISESLQWITKEIDGKESVTEILRIEHLQTKDVVSRVLVRIHTGRKHQIRRHLSSLGHPIVGDNLYNKNGLTFGTGLLLCACYLEFIQPVSKEKIEVSYPIPTKISKYKIRN